MFCKLLDWFGETTWYIKNKDDASTSQSKSKRRRMRIMLWGATKLMKIATAPQYIFGTIDSIPETTHTVLL